MSVLIVVLYHQGRRCLIVGLLTVSRCMVLKFVWARPEMSVRHQSAFQQSPRLLHLFLNSSLPTTFTIALSHGR
jgi:hypothetical protein